jgi:hypothetical protein
MRHQDTTARPLLLCINYFGFHVLVNQLLLLKCLLKVEACR